jgi:hypothetical protein
MSQDFCFQEVDPSFWANLDDPNEVKVEDCEIFVERPIAFQSNPLHFNLPRTGSDFMMLHRWPYMASKRWMSYGFKCSELARVFNSVPPYLLSSIDQMMKLLAFKYSDVFDPSGGKNNQNEVESQCQGPQNGFEPPFRNIWNDDDTHGICVFDFNPISQERQHVDINGICSSIRQMHEEEYRARLANHDLPLYWSDQDFLSQFVFTLRNHFRTEIGSYYMRFIVGVGDSRHGVLVRETIKNNFDAMGRVTRVIISTFIHESNAVSC